jgi:hypothetical protein
MIDYVNNKVSVGDKVMTFDVNANGMHFREGVIESIEKKVDDEQPMAQEWATIVFTHKIGGEEYKTRVFRTSNAIILI